MPDYIMRWVASRYGDADLHEELGILTAEIRARKAAEAAAPSADTAGPAEPANGGNGGERGNGHTNGGNGDSTPSARQHPAAGGRRADRRAAQRSRRSCRAWSWARPARCAEA